MIVFTEKCLKIGLKNHVTVRVLSTKPSVQTKTDDSPDIEWNDAKSFSEIPGPSKPQFLRAILPGGKYHGLQIIDLLKKCRSEYGTIAKFPGFFGKSDQVFSFDPILTEKVLRTEGNFPLRTGSDTLKYYREKLRPDVFKGFTGLVTDQGETWWNLRSAVNPVMLKPQNVKRYILVADEVAQDFMKKIKLIRDGRNEMPENFVDELNKWSLESIGVIALDHRLGTIHNEQKNTETDQLIKAVKEVFQLSLEFEVMPSVWKYYKTPKFMRLMGALDVVTEIGRKYVNQSVERLDNTSDTESNRSVLQQLLKINRDYAILMSFDMMLAGIDTTSSALAGILYHLAKHPEKQQKLREEVHTFLPNKSSKFNVDSLNNIPYLRACIKESMRMIPVFSGNLRGAGRDIVLGGYQVPKNTDVSMISIASQHDESYFPNNDQFIPERWLKNDSSSCPSMGTKNAFVYLPFGFGVRSCIGKRFAEMEMEILISRLLTEFKVEWNYGPIRFGGLINSPLSPLKYKLTDL